jgi:hypothetical protein
VRNITEPGRASSVNGIKEQGAAAETQTRKDLMMLGILTTLFLLFGLGAALRRDGSNGLIARRPYNNRYNDATGAREDHLG